MKLIDISPSDYRFLYELLAQRDETINISHREMPTYGKHVEFIESEPYDWHKIIMAGADRIGVCYLSKKNEIGIFIDKQFQGKGYGGKVLAMILQEFRHRDLLANINPKNLRSAALFERMGFKLIQQTYALRLPCGNSSDLPASARQR